MRSIAEVDWRSGRVLNLSVTGVLLHIDRPYALGERVEVEIDFLTQPESRTVVAGAGHVVREHEMARNVEAIHFDLDCAPKAVDPKSASARAARGGRR